MLTKPESCKGCPLSCAPWGSMFGYVPADGTGENGVLVVLEAAGEDEAANGRPTVGRAGQYLWQQLKRVNLERDSFRIHNVLSCQPPGNKLVGMPYANGAITHCAPNLDKTIAEHKAAAVVRGKNPVIVALGVPAFKRIMGLGDHEPILKEDYGCYPHWSPTYNCWVYAADHPSYIMRGNHHLVSVLQWVFTRAVEVSANGLTLDAPAYICDPSANGFELWVDQFLKDWKEDPSLLLSYDIETPMKSGKDEEKVAREEDDDYTIIRCSFAYRAGQAVSVPWQPEYRPQLERLFSIPCTKLGWNLNYDSPRVRAQMDIAGSEVDAMLAWHTLNSNLPKGLGFVTPFYNQTSSMWKHLSNAQPAFYNAADADMALRNYIGIKRDLIKNDLWRVFDRHVIQLNQVLAFMSRIGVMRDAEMRLDAEKRLVAALDIEEQKIEAAVPFEAKKLKVFKATPKPLKGLEGDELTEAVKSHGLVKAPGTVRTKRCNRCGAEGVKAVHFKSVGKKRLKAGDDENLCFGAGSEAVEVPAELYARIEPWKISNKSLQTYQKVRGHKPLTDRRSGRITYDVNAMKTLVRKYPSDPLYPIISRYRKYDKLLGTYIGVTQPDGRIRGGLPVGRDGAVHTLYNHNPETLRLASQNPNMQNLPRPGGKDDPATIVRNLFVARPGCRFVARDFSGIEAVLVGYEARSARYIRLAKMDVHSFYTAYALHSLDGRVSANDLPLLSWDDEKLGKRLAEIKKEFKHDRNSLFKHLTHAINFGQGAKGAQDKIYKETDVIQPLETISYVMNVYKELFPEIVKWQNDIRLQADADGYLKNAFGYTLRFNRVFAWKLEHGQWVKEPGDDAQAVLAFKPQSNAAGIMKEALLRLYYNHFEEAGQFLRMTIHDEIFTEPTEDRVKRVDELLTLEMERPIPELPLPAEWGMGPYLSILTEGKEGYRWAEMH